MQLYLISLVIIILSIAGIIQAIRWLHEADDVLDYVISGAFTVLALVTTGLFSFFWGWPGQEYGVVPPLWMGFIPTMLFALYWVCLSIYSAWNSFRDWTVDRCDAYLAKEEDEKERLRQETQRSNESMYYRMLELFDNSTIFDDDKAMTLAIVCKKLELPNHYAVGLAVNASRQQQQPLS